MRKYTKKLSVFFIAAIIATSLSACSLSGNSGKSDNNTTKASQKTNKDSNSNSNSSSSPSQETKEQSKQTKEQPKPTQNAQKTEELKKEKEIYDGQVYIQNNVVVATMIIKDKISEQEAKALAEKYAKQLKDQYKDMKVNVQAVQNGKSVADIVIDK